MESISRIEMHQISVNARSPHRQEIVRDTCSVITGVSCKLSVQVRAVQLEKMGGTRGPTWSDLARLMARF
jgi:hypothetical protein